MSLAATVAATGLILGGSGAAADALDQIFQVRGATHAAGKTSQQKIDKLADQTQDLLGQYRSETSQVDSLRVYNEQLQKLVSSQQSELTKLQSEIDGVTEIEREIFPLMQRMVDMLDRVVKADVPFLLGEREKRVAKLRDLLNRSDVTVAEKYRLIIEAYTIENNFGHTIEAYQDTILDDGAERDVDFLRIGRSGLYYQTRDGLESAAWDRGASDWVILDSSYAGPIKAALKVARKQSPPDLLLLPFQGAEDAK
jgi:chromosome segregation ATPase